MIGIQQSSHAMSAMSVSGMYESSYFMGSVPVIAFAVILLTFFVLRYMHRHKIVGDFSAGVIFVAVFVVMFIVLSLAWLAS